MRTCALGCVGMVVVTTAMAAETPLTVDLLRGHPIHHAASGKAGVVMAIAITGQNPTTDHGNPATVDLAGLCDDLRSAAGLALEVERDLLLEVVFVVPYKDMAVEGYYLPTDGATGPPRLLRGDGVARQALEGILAHAGVPPSVLDETGVEHEVSCELDRPVWQIRWEDVQSIGDAAPEAVIDRAAARFMALHKRVTRQVAKLAELEKMQLEERSISPAAASRHRP